MYQINFTIEQCTKLRKIKQCVHQAGQWGDPTIYQHLVIREFHVFLVIRHLWKSAPFQVGANLELLSIRLQGGIRFFHIIYPLAHEFVLPLPVSPAELMRDNWAYSVRSLRQHDGLGSAYLPGSIMSAHGDSRPP
jgi:hypothetical protein